MKVEIFSRVENNKLVRNRKLLSDAISKFNNKDVAITIEKKKKKRSLEQNNYLHLLFTIFTKELNELGEHFQMEEVKELCKKKFCTVEVFSEITGEKIGERVKGTSEMTTTEINHLIEQVIIWAADFFHIQLPYPNEELTINF